MSAKFICDTAQGAVLTIHVQPNASRTECAGPYGNALRIRVAAPPADGAANEALVRFLAKQCGIPASSIVIRAGSSARRKQILFKDLPAQSVAEMLQP
jgi:uncharacterized protein (TIGR00251 family)